MDYCGDVGVGADEAGGEVVSGADVAGAGAGAGMVFTGGAAVTGGGVGVEGADGAAPTEFELTVAPVLTPELEALRIRIGRSCATARVVDRLL